jgi:GMP synthase-like glutamine amidotransferase
MILIISTCKEKLHEMEFVKPIEKILGEKGIKFFTRHYKDIKKEDFANADKLIITGTSLKDNEFIKDINYFNWIRTINKPVLGICAGMQIIEMLFSGKVKKKTEIGYYKENFVKGFLGLKGEQEVYHLHNNYTTVSSVFEIYSKSGSVVQAIKHKEKEIYGVLFHPEVRNREVIERFAEL